MLTLTKTTYGFKAVASGTLTATELANALLKFKRLQPVATEFGYVCDQRALTAMSVEVQARLRDVMGQFLGSGLARIAIICSSTAVAVQSNGLMAGTPAERFSKAFDGMDPRWESQALRWVTAAARTSAAPTDRPGCLTERAA